MNTQEIKVLINEVESRVYCGTSGKDWSKNESWEFDHKGSLPVYIVDAMSSYGYNEDEFHIMFYGIQPSGRVLVFIMPHKAEDPFGKAILPSGKHYSMTVGRYAEINVVDCFDEGEPCLEVNELRIIPDSEIEEIKAEITKKGGVA